MPDTKIIEINGIKVEVDLRSARVITAYKVGDRVKLLRKKYDGYESLPAVIVGFDAFENLPTLVVASFEVSWGSDPKIEFHYINAQTKEKELAPAIDDELPMSRQDALDQFDRCIDVKLREVEALREKRAYFERRFGQVAERQTVEQS